MQLNMLILGLFTAILCIYLGIRTVKNFKRLRSEKTSLKRIFYKFSFSWLGGDVAVLC